MKFRLSVANRLFFGFSSVSVGVLVITAVAVLTLLQIKQSITDIVEKVGPTEKAVNALQIESLNLSLLVSQYFSTGVISEVRDTSELASQSIDTYLVLEQDLKSLLAQYPELESSQNILDDISEGMPALFEDISANIGAYYKQSADF